MCAGVADFNDMVTCSLSGTSSCMRRTCSSSTLGVVAIYSTVRIAVGHGKTDIELSQFLLMITQTAAHTDVAQNWVADD